MLKYLKNMDRRLASINGSLAAIAKVCLILAKDKHVVKLVQRASEQLDLLGEPHAPEVCEKHTAPRKVEIVGEVEAVQFLERGDRQLRRYRSTGRVNYHKDDNGYIRYLKSDLERLFEEIHGFPKGGFKRDDA